MSSPPLAQVFELDKDQMTEKIKSSYGSNCKEISFLPENTVIEKTETSLVFLAVLVLLFPWAILEDFSQTSDGDKPI